MAKKTHEQFMKDFYKKNIYAESIEVLGEYQGCKIPLLCKCKIDGYEWSPTPDSLLRGCGCPKCYDNRRSKNQRKTHEQFMKDFYEKNPNSQNIEILGEYINSNTPILCRCKIDGHEWSPKPKKLLQKRGCPQCANNTMKTHEQFLQELYKINPNIEPLEEYKGANIQIKCRCKIDNCEWTPTPSDLLNNSQGCPQCALLRVSGKNNYRYNPNLTDEEREKGRKTKEYQDFIKNTLKYFDYTCQITNQRGGNLVVHHLNGYNWYIEGRMDINNVIVITKELHDKFHNIYGRGNNTKEQWEDFINNNNNNNDRDVI